MGNPIANITYNLGDNIRNTPTVFQYEEDLTTCRVKYVKYTKEDPNFDLSFQNEDTIGWIKCIPVAQDTNETKTERYIVARPLNKGTYPLVNEIVNLHTYKYLSDSNNISKVFYFYSKPADVWSNPNHNAIPVDTDTLTDKVDLGNDFVEQSINPLQPKAGDIISQGRQGQAVKFSSDENGNPQTIIRNGQPANLNKPGWEHIFEDINNDPSSIHILSKTTNGLIPANKNLKTFKVNLNAPINAAFSTLYLLPTGSEDTPVFTESTVLLDNTPTPQNVEPINENDLIWDDAEYEVDEVIKNFLAQADWNKSEYDIKNEDTNADIVEPPPSPLPPAKGVDPQRLLDYDKNPIFIDEVDKIIKNINKYGNTLTRNDLLKVMIAESAGLNPQAVNKQPPGKVGKNGDGKVVKKSGEPDSDNLYIRAEYRATGLIQFMPTTAKSLGTSTQAIYNMTAIDQLKYVEKYIIQFSKNGQLKNYIDIYAAIFFPISLGKPDTFILQSKTQSAKEVASQNQGILKAAGKSLSQQPYITAKDVRIYFKKTKNRSFPSWYKDKP